MKKDKCGQCGRIIKPDEETMHVETRCSNFYLCSKCIVESRDYWIERIDEALANREKVESKE